MSAIKWTEGQLVVLIRANLPDRLARVEKVTPTGRPRVLGDLFRLDGSRNDGPGTLTRILPATDEDVQRIHLARDRRVLADRFRFATLTREQVDAINAVLDGE